MTEIEVKVMGTCHRFKYDAVKMSIANGLRNHALTTVRNAIMAVTPVGAKLSRKELRARTNLTNEKRNIAAIQIGEMKLVAHSSVHKNNPYFSYFTSGTPDPNDVLFVSANKDINDEGNGHSREWDAEAKLFYELQENRKDLLNDPVTIELYTHKQPCLSCDYYIIQFLKNYPLVTLNIYFERPYPDEG
ncbi:deaminase domain-containing protein [Paenibacillus albus]|uniref:Uncharacterized protein n=1 Tax=Paenibacillus albus TaxID=2495582 RepID=A0A3S9A3V9_9BACL|nr:deaminase domain-containing protein [Paenibacillus albus]AZN40384.1 hypothetical protein EJC50_12545 [Paenibacillus albus]